MKILGNGSQLAVQGFGRALTSAEEKDFKQVTDEAMQLLGKDDGMRIFKVFQTSLPSEQGQNLGVGRLNSDRAIDCLKFNALYTGSNIVKIFPAGQIPSRLRFHNYFCPYERSATVVGEDNINFFKLTSGGYGSLLSNDDIAPLTISDSFPYVNYEHELDEKTGIASFLILKAYENLQKADTPEKVAIKKEFEEFKASNKSNTMDRLAIAPFVRDIEPDLFLGIDTSKEKQQKFETYKEKYEKEIDVFKLGKFLALKNLNEAKSELNKNGLELFGDCPIGFTEDEVYCFPEAFYPQNITPGWGFRALKYPDVTKEGTVANRLFTEKIKWHLEAFDGIRFDVGWQYFRPTLNEIDEKGNSTKFSIDVGNQIIEYIEQTAKSVKGENFDLKKLMYEADAGIDDFQIFDWKNGVAIPRKNVEGKTLVLTDVYEHAGGFGWGNPSFFYRAGLKDYVLGTNNHDGIPLRALAECDDEFFKNQGVNIEGIKENNIEALAKSLGLSKSFLQKPKNFIKAKFAELFFAKNHFLFFNDVVGNKERMDTHCPEPSNYRYKVANDYEIEYHTALQNKVGFNLAESLRLALKSKGVDKSNPMLYEKIEYYSKLLYSKGAKTKAEAEKIYSV